MGRFKVLRVTEGSGFGILEMVPLFGSRAIGILELGFNWGLGFRV